MTSPTRVRAGDTSLDEAESYWHPADPELIRAIGARALAVYREVRAQARAMNEEQLAATIAAEFRRQRLRSADPARRGKRRVAEG